MPLFYRRLPRFEYVSPGTVEEAVAFLSGHGEDAKLLAGGTDLVPQLKGREIKARYVVDLKAIPGLDAVSPAGKSVATIGALATIDAIARSPLVSEHLPLLVQAASVMASPQVRNRGTFVGNICSAVPSADSAPGLLALDARVHLLGPGGERIVAMDRFFTGPRKTVVARDEVAMAIEVPFPPAGSRGVYLKLSPRHSMDLAVVGVAVQAVCDNGVCSRVRIGLGAVAPTPVRAPLAEALLEGRAITPELIDEAARHSVNQCSPIDDHRASQEYRCDMVYVMTRRALTQVLLEGGR